MIQVYKAFNSMYLLNIQIRVINMLLLILIWYLYIRNKKVVFQRGRYYTAILGLVTSNILFDIIAVYGLFRKNVIPYSVNRTFQLFYLESLVLSIYGIYLHIMSLCGQKQELKKPKTIIQT